MSAPIPTAMVPLDTDRLRTAISDSYLIERELGAGGMATVYLASDIRHQRKVAVKVLRPDLAATLGPDRFIREITIAAGLTHPHILPLHDSGQADGFLFYVMPFVEGESLRQRLAREGELPIPEAVRILRDMADAMAYAHQHGVVHRDIKPENVMLSGRHALVTDFGVAKAVSDATGRQTLTTAGVALGTPAYMAPEQAAASPHVDHRADIYAFGVVAYELLAGRPPFVRASPQALLAAHLTLPVEPVTLHRPSIPAPLAALVMQCLEKKPADRVQTADELIPKLEAALTPSEGVTPTATPLVSAVRPSARRWKVAIAALVLGAVVGAWWLFGRGKASAPVSPRLAVLPFENRTGDSSLAYLATLAAELITTGLLDAQVVEVVPTQAIAAILRDTASAGATNRLDAVAVATRATIVVSGTLYRIGDSLRFGADLTEAHSGRVLATVGPVSAPQGDAMAGLSAIRERVIAQLAAELDPRLGAFATGWSPPSLEALRLVSEGWVENWRDLAKSEALFRQALAIDSTFLAARLSLALALANQGRIVEADSVLLEVERDPAKPVGWYRYNIAWLRARLNGDRDAAYRSMRSQQSINPSALYMQALGFEESQLNRPRAALEVYRQIDPLGAEMREVPGYWFHVTNALHMLGDHDEELAAARRGRDQFPRALEMIAHEIGARAARKEEGAIVGLLDEARNYPARPGLSLGLVSSTASAELLVHGDSAAAARLALWAVEWYEALSPTDRGNLRLEYVAALAQTGKNRQALDLVGDCDPGHAGVACRRWTGVLVARLGDSAAARLQLRHLDALQLHPRILQADQAWAQGCILIALGETSRGIAQLRQAFDKGASHGSSVHRDPCIVPARDNAELKELLRPKG